MDEMPDWQAEVLHIVWGFANREHERHVLTAHAQLALEAVPEEVLRAARIDRSRPPGAVARS